MLAVLPFVQEPASLGGLPSRGERRPGRAAPGPPGPFKADGAETADHYSISEWWLDPHTTGPGAHTHSEDDVSYVLEGTMSFLVGERWVDAPKGAFVLAPGGTPYDFQKPHRRAGRSAQRLRPRGLRAADAGHQGVVPPAPAR